MSKKSSKTPPFSKLFNLNIFLLFLISVPFILAAEKDPSIPWPFKNIDGVKDPSFSQSFETGLFHCEKPLNYIAYFSEGNLYLSDPDYGSHSIRMGDDYDLPENVLMFYIPIEKKSIIRDDGSTIMTTCKTLVMKGVDVSASSRVIDSKEYYVENLECSSNKVNEALEVAGSGIGGIFYSQYENLVHKVYSILAWVKGLF
jgi:hypothetical protein